MASKSCHPGGPAEPGERVHEAVARLLQAPERPALGVPRLVFPVEGHAAPIRRPGVDQRAEVELLRHLPPKAVLQLVVRPARRDHMFATRPRRADAWMYLRDTGDRSFGPIRTSIRANRGSRCAATDASRRSSMRSAPKPRPPHASARCA